MAKRLNSELKLYGIIYGQEYIDHMYRKPPEKKKRTCLKCRKVFDMKGRICGRCSERMR